jgi:hypothetical protein
VCGCWQWSFQAHVDLAVGSLFRGLDDTAGCRCLVVDELHHSNGVVQLIHHISGFGLLLTRLMFYKSKSEQ